MKRVVLGLFVLLLASCGAKSDKVVWKLGHIYAESNILHSVSVKFAEEVKERTGGAMEIQVLPNSLEGSEVDNINGIRLGTSDMTISGESLQGWAPKAALIATPYLFQSIDDVRRGVEGDVGKEISDEIAEKAGLKTLFYMLRLPRNLTSNRPIRKPADLNRMILRVPAVPVFVTAWEALGAKPTPMALNEVFTSLQQGTIAGQENPIDLIYSSGFQEVQKYLNLTEHVYGWLYFVVGVKQYESLSPELQKHVMAAAQVAQEYGREELMKMSTEFEQKLKDSGMEFVEVDKKAFQDIVVPAISGVLTPDQKQLYEKILANQ